MPVSMRPGLRETTRISFAEFEGGFLGVPDDEILGEGIGKAGLVVVPLGDVGPLQELLHKGFFICLRQFVGLLRNDHIREGVGGVGGDIDDDALLHEL